MEYIFKYSDCHLKWAGEVDCCADHYDDFDRYQVWMNGRAVEPTETGPYFDRVTSYVRNGDQIWACAKDSVQMPIGVDVSGNEVSLPTMDLDSLDIQKFKRENEIVAWRRPKKTRYSVTVFDMKEKTKTIYKTVEHKTVPMSLSDFAYLQNMSSSGGGQQQ